MAYQSKKYNKFIASTMTAAIVASAVAPAAGFAASDFKDVPSDNFYFDYVSALANAKIIDGRPDGSFDLGGKINRAEASKMVANILKLDTKKAPVADFSDVDQTKWYAEFINALYSKELINGKGQGKFDPNGTLTRGEFAKMVVEAYNLSLKADGPVAKFKDVDGDKWYADYVKILFSHGLVTGTTETTFSPDAQIKRADFAKLLTETDWEKGTTLEKGHASVESVTPVNGKTIEVKFTKAVDADTLKNALNADVIKVVASAGSKDAGTITQTLSADGKTLTLKAANFFKGEYTVQVPFEIVKDVDGKFVSPINSKVTVNDLKAPVLSTATTTIKDTKDGIKKVTLTFDEEVSSIELVKINGTNIDNPVIEGNKATIEVDLDATKTYDVTVVKATDAAGNVKDIQSAALNVVVDNTAPSIVNVEAMGENQVKVTVDEELKDNALTITGKVGSFTDNIVQKAEVNAANHKEYTVTLKSDFLFKSGNSDTVTLTVAKDKLSDEIGNTNAADISKTVVVTKDTAAPTVVDVATSSTDGKVTSFTVTYNEEITVSPNAKMAVTNSKGEIKAQDQVVREITKVNAKTVVFKLADNVAADKYSFELAEGFVKDNALSPSNNSAKYAFTVDVSEASNPVETTFAISKAESTGEVITVEFGEKVKATGTGNALNPEAYEVNGVKLPANTVIEFAKNNNVIDQTKVMITLPAGFVKTTDAKAVFTVNGVQTLDNKENVPYTNTIKVTDNTAPEAQSIAITELDKVTVTYSEAIKIATHADISDEISLFNSKGEAVSFKEFKVNEEGKLILTVDNASSVVKLVTNTVDAAQADIKDAAENVQKAGLTVNK
ncbi:S-layer homology domain-containing protein [Cytobacillus sp. FJAT-53684]|uniref:S-layer homology domain-containing protein n=1 Tax=Cytobacillus mangrovibacter TaxID=3299024 RepID=A0ABW6JX79_9BACI